MKRRRPPISDGMKYRALRLHGAVLVRCLDCVTELNRINAMNAAAGPDGFGQLGDSGTWHTLASIQFDHVWELADGGKHGAKHLRPKCTPHHRKKSATQLKHRKHLDRAAKKHRGEHVSKHPMPKTGRKLQSRPFPKYVRVESYNPARGSTLISWERKK